MAGIDFFDVDHTLTRRSSVSRFVALGIRRGVFPLRLLVLLPWYSLTYRLGIFRPRVRDNSFPSLRGLSRTALEQLARDSFDHTLIGDLFPEAVALIRSLRAEGRRVILATSSLDIVVAPLAEHLGADGVLATTLEFVNGVCTGRIKGVPMFRREKKDRVFSFLAGEGVNPAECSFHSDSIYDLPLLEAVGDPVAVNPDFRLRRIARRRGWQIRELGSAPPGKASRAGRRRSE